LSVITHVIERLLYDLILDTSLIIMDICD